MIFEIRNGHYEPRIMPAGCERASHRGSKATAGARLAMAAGKHGRMSQPVCFADAGKEERTPRHRPFEVALARAKAVDEG